MHNSESRTANEREPTGTGNRDWQHARAELENRINQNK
jgi:hypothetical protein